MLGGDPLKAGPMSVGPTKAVVVMLTPSIAGGLPASSTDTSGLGMAPSVDSGQPSPPALARCGSPRLGTAA